jgi:hypothetical protein
MISSKYIMEIEQQVFPLFSSFIRDLGKTYPEIKNCLYRNYEDCLTEVDPNQGLSECPKGLSEYPKIQSFLDVIHTHNTQITNRDPSFFEIEEVILRDISFPKLWSKNISEKTRSTIWKYFQTFGLLAINLKSSQALKDALSSIHKDEAVNVEDKSVAKDLQKVKRLTQGIQGSDGSQETDDLGMEDMLGGMMNSNIGKIAQEVAESMDIESMFGNLGDSGNPMEIMSQMMNPEKMGSIFQNINSVVEEKMKEGSFSKDDLKKEAEGMYGNMSKNPMFANMMSQVPKDTKTKDTKTKDTKTNTKDTKDKDTKTKDKDTKDKDNKTKDKDNKQILRDKIKEKQKERCGQ